MKRTLMALGLMSVGFLAAAPASAATVLTAWSSYSFSSTTLSLSTLVPVNGFDTTLGTLTSVHLRLNLNETLNNTAAVISGTADVAVGVPTPLTATATTTATVLGGPALSSTNTLTTPGFVGNVFYGFLNDVGTATLLNYTTPESVITGNPTTLAQYLGTATTFNVFVTSSGNQGGSVPGSVLTGNNGNINGSVQVAYDYTSNTPVPEPTAISLIGLGLAGLAAARKRKAA